MTYVPITDTEDLLDGIGTFEPVEGNELERLLTAEERAKGLTDGLSTMHQIAYNHVVTDFLSRKIDVTGVTDTVRLPLLQAATCHVVMAKLYGRAGRQQDEKGPDRLNERASWARYKELTGLVLWPTDDGGEEPIGESMRIMRG